MVKVNLFEQAINKEELLDFALGKGEYFLADREWGTHWVLGTWLYQLVPYCSKIGSYAPAKDMLLELLFSASIPMEDRLESLLYHIYVFYYLKSENRVHSPDIVKEIEPEIINTIKKYSPVLERTYKTEQLNKLKQSIVSIKKRGGLTSYNDVEKISNPEQVEQDSTTQQITWSELIKMTPEETEDCDNIYQKYQAWHKLDPDDEKRMIYLGSLVPDVPEQAFSLKEYPSFEQYWSKESPIALAYYPYYGCEVFRLKSCSSLYLIYTEFAGHAPEKRCRLLQKRLIVTTYNHL
ncbi:MAG: hypothetical protein DHS20C18_50810 [Saprospiraceae bacterium]|nr:MAG: hypothetical protein DHS20C18_50810 [Saprospiraceae bacterium]